MELQPNIHSDDWTIDRTAFVGEKLSLDTLIDTILSQEVISDEDIKVLNDLIVRKKNINRTPYKPTYLELGPGDRTLINELKSEVRVRHIDLLTSMGAESKLSEDQDK
jgi:hypothetical protein